ncbi:hypothetical protein LWI28_020858 [Acer negundo]|uniref:Uncharacterized protein n=1 Tax=Acer negundo TaxID=4023 RepID=A0AAD5IS09_ACENE|nr:hypothetical protein LWI28_020858 [Acer negundo]
MLMTKAISGKVKVRYCKKSTKFRNSMALMRGSPSVAESFTLVARGVEHGLHSVMDFWWRRSNVYFTCEICKGGSGGTSVAEGGSMACGRCCDASSTTSFNMAGAAPCSAGAAISSSTPRVGSGRGGLGNSASSTLLGVVVSTTMGGVLRW